MIEIKKECDNFRAEINGLCLFDIFKFIKLVF